MGFLGSLFGGGGAPSSSATNKQNTGTASGAGSVQLNDAKTGAIHMGNETSIKTSDKYNVNANENSNNKVTVGQGGTVNYNTYSSGGGDSSMLDSIGNLFSKIGSGTGANGQGIVVDNTPAAGTASVIGAASNIRWGLILGVGAVGFAIYYFFLRKK
jgi:hypothetical protein